MCRRAILIEKSTGFIKLFGYDQSRPCSEIVYEANSIAIVAVFSGHD